ncbi:hypothetical protein F5Y18DRAFT_405871 [Xylariaceae sp. FL1019]|nr:hypothetical protein F5Y18DRAFT_405871 [Xylariaceae sp. FL1019]
MVKLWPWKGEDSSPASFEKTLSTLATKITATQAIVDRVRNNSRRIKLLWTLYLAFAYLVYSIVLILVVGWHNLGAWEWTGMAGGPILIYLVRTATNAYYSYRLDNLETRLKAQQAERTKTIQKLKDTTKYDSTLELLEKYGGGSEKRNKQKKQPDGEGAPPQENEPARKKHRQSIDSAHVTARTQMRPPPTANLQRPSTSSGLPPNRAGQFGTPPPAQLRSPQQDKHTEEFAPNAGPLPTTYNQYEMNPGPPRWYDRILDSMLGEDEMAPKNRIVLICNQCRLVNGQAPPGIKNLAEVGIWKCMGCGAKNGELDEGKKIMQQVLGDRKTPAQVPEERDSDRSSDIIKIEQEDGEQSMESDTDRVQSPRELRAKRREQKP